MNLKHAGLYLPILLCLGIVSCSSAPFQNDDQGWVLMNYITHQEKGVTGVEPVDLGEDVEMVQEVFPGSLEELKATILESTNSEELPAPSGTYRGSSLTWELYMGETQIPELGPFTVTLLMGIATDDAGSYYVVLVTLPERYEEDADKFQSVFYQTLYAFSPIE